MKQYDKAEVEVREQVVGGVNYTIYTSAVQILDSGFVLVDEANRLYPPDKVNYIKLRPQKEK